MGQLARGGSNPLGRIALGSMPVPTVGICIEAEAALTGPRGAYASPVPSLPVSRGSLSLTTFDRRLEAGATSCDLSALRFVDAYGLVGTACTLVAAVNAGGRPPIEYPDESHVREHLTRMGFRVAAPPTRLPGGVAGDGPDRSSRCPGALDEDRSRLWRRAAFASPSRAAARSCRSASSRSDPRGLMGARGERSRALEVCMSLPLYPGEAQ